MMVTDTVRYILILGGFAVIGLNISIIRHAPKLVTAVLPWRIYTTGQCFFDLAAIYGLHRHIGQPVGWGVVLVSIAIALTLVSLVLLQFAHHRKQLQPALQ